MDKTPEKSPIAQKEEEILKFWRENKIFEKSLKKASPKGEFVFYDGPPFATGLPHYGHILASTIKDVIPRFKTMQGYHVPRKWGWDCHGLPIENIVEKELNLKAKKEIVDFGIDKFNEEARKIVLRYANEWREQIPRFGRWVDMDNDYRTMDASYTESVWWAFKTLHEKGLVYEGFKSMHLCPRCETTLSNFEVAQGYKDITDISVYAKFELVDEPGTFMLAWTTTPWTLPGNVALAVNQEILYATVERQNEAGKLEKFIIAKERVEKLFGKEGYKIISSCSGKELVGKSYKPVFNYYENDSKLKNKENAWKIYGADFVTTTDGSGIVHIAPAFGSDDYELSKKEKLPFIQHVDISGKFKPEVTDFSGQSVKPKDDHQKGDVEIIKYLARKGLLFSKEKIIHSYPHCWRCDTPLLNYATSSWFVKVSSIRNRLSKENDKIKWIPEEVGKYRFGNWLKDAKDWAVSRSRFWGAPIPVWKCEKCHETKFIGSVEELKKKVGRKNDYFIVRHGESKSNSQNVVTTDPKNTFGLTEKGQKEVLMAVEELKKKNIDYIFASDILRTKETAEIIKKSLGIDSSRVVFDKRLREINFGEIDGKNRSVYSNAIPNFMDRFDSRLPGGESFDDIRMRLGDFIYEIDKKFEGKKILLITHETPAWLLECVARGVDSKECALIRGELSDYLKTAEVKPLLFSPIPHNEKYEIDLHRPGIDKMVFGCDCEGVMKRVPEVFDCWFESGSMAYAQDHYPFNKKNFNPFPGWFKKSKAYPADFIAEGLDQTRGWFYSLLVLGVTLFGKSPFKSVVVNGTLLAQDGQKMSKRLKNYPDPLHVVNKYGADAMRFYMIASPAVRGQDMNFLEQGVDEVMKKLIMRLGNVAEFYKLYEDSSRKRGNSKSTNALDLWILARLNEVISKVTIGLSSYELDRGAREIMDFVDDLSTWYLRRSRDRFKDDDIANREAALDTTFMVLKTLSLILAPYTPFFAEMLYKLIGEEKGDDALQSVHLESWPVSNSKLKKEENILEDMREVRRIVTLALEARNKCNVKVRQPLSELKVKNENLKSKKDFIELIKDEVNVKEIIFDQNLKEEVELDLEITPELLREGMVREFMRAMQDLRKKTNLKPRDVVNASVQTNPEGENFLQEFKDQIFKTTKVTLNLAEVFQGEEIKVGHLRFLIKIS